MLHGTRAKRRFILSVCLPTAPALPLYETETSVRHRFCWAALGQAAACQYLITWGVGTYALYVVSDPLVNTNRIRIITLALGARLPTMHGSRDHVEAGGLMSFGPNFPDLFRRAADYVDKILRGTKPGDIPVEQPTKFDLVINLTTTMALGLTIPEPFLLRADEVIE
jgi:hypothetical protein